MPNTVVSGWAFERRATTVQIVETSARTTIVFTSIDDVSLGIEEGHRRIPALRAALAAERIVLVFCSHRTRAEIEGLRQSVGVFHPFICEDGAAAFVPLRYFPSELHNARVVGGYKTIEFGLPYDLVVKRIRRAAEQHQLGVRGFADMSIEQVARECRLSLLDARLAKLREYGEPFRLLQPNEAAEARLIRALSSSGITCRRHGDFLHALSVDGPAAAMAVLTTLYRTSLGPVLTAATGCGAIIVARVDVNLDAAIGGSPVEGQTVAWMEWVVDAVRTYRAHQPAPADAARM
jgi:mannosyl-3-phosphoglycerate phosphatase